MDAFGSLNPSPRTLEVESLESFDRLAATGTRTMHGWHAQSLDLRGRIEQLLALDVEGSIFLGCTFDEGVEAALRRRGALIFPRLDGVPFNPYRSRLYSPQELYEGISENPYEASPDAKVYQWSIQPGLGHRMDATLASALHDHSIGDALEEFIGSDLCAGRTMVGVMGGHTAQRGTSEFAAAATLGQLLARSGRVVATGGGPGAMEAANMGAYLSDLPDAALKEALAGVAAVPGFRPSVSAWAREAAAVVGRYPDGTPSLGIPTWRLPRLAASGQFGKRAGHVDERAPGGQCLRGFGRAGRLKRRRHGLAGDAKATAAKAHSSSVLQQFAAGCACQHGQAGQIAGAKVGEGRSMFEHQLCRVRHVTQTHDVGEFMHDDGGCLGVTAGTGKDLTELRRVQ